MIHLSRSSDLKGDPTSHAKVLFFWSKKTEFFVMLVLRAPNELGVEIWRDFGGYGLLWGLGVLHATGTFI